MRAIVYCRVSTAEQTKNLSLPTQLAACRAYCERNDFKVVEEFIEEGESAKTTDRPELQRLLEFCRKQKGKVDVLVVYNVTRFARDRMIRTAHPSSKLPSRSSQQAAARVLPRATTAWLGTQDQKR